jgi:hypothetical protein
MTETAFTTTTENPINTEYTSNGNTVTQQASLDGALPLLILAGLTLGHKRLCGQPATTRVTKVEPSRS